LTHTRLDNRYAIRMSIGQTNTERRHVAAAWELISSENYRDVQTKGR
jgi:aromatic-L-amino-acid decarboxylase